MRTSTRLLVLGLGTLLVTPTLWAQGEVKGTEVGEGEGEETVGESNIAKIRAVERGLWFSVDYGPYYQIPLSLQQEMCFPCIGSQIGVRVGYDILNNLSADLFVRGSYANFKTDYATLYSGDIASYYTGGAVRFSYITTDRFHATARLGGGAAFLFPSEAANNSLIAPAADLGLGVEYFTRLRHMSIGCEIETLAFLWPFSVGFSVLPTFKYTF